MSETLEAMARALFKSWFVDFDPVRAKMEGRDPGLPQALADLFPARLVDSELGEIPEGWEVQSVGDHTVNFDSKRVPVSGAERSERQGPYPYHGAAGVMDHVDDYLFDGIHLLVGEDGSVVQNDGLAVTQYVWGKIWVNNHAHVLQGRGAVSTEQLYLYFRFETVAPYVTGAVQPKLSQGRMNKMPFVFAGDSLCRAFAQTIQSWFARLRASVEETKTLAKVRDALLPKLISGELRVTDAEKFIGKVA
jgi:type I restriction enzyme S subunit